MTDGDRCWIGRWGVWGRGSWVAIVNTVISEGLTEKDTAAKTGRR